MAEETMTEAATPATPRSDHSTTTLFVSSLPFTATQQDLETHFTDIGPVRSSFIIRDRNTGKSTGCGFVTFAVAEDAKRAIVELKHTAFCGGGGGARPPRMQMAVRKSVVVERKKLGLPVDPDAVAKLEKKAEDDLKRMKKRLKVPTTSSTDATNAKPSTIGGDPAPSAPSGPNAVQLSLLPKDLTKKQLYKRVRKLGDIVEIIMPDPSASQEASTTTNEPSTARVIFKTADDAAHAIERLDGHTLKGAVIHAAIVTKPVHEIPQRARLIIRNLAFHCTPKNLITVFTPYGSIASCTVPRTPDGKARGFGFIEFDRMEDATRALTQGNGMKILNRPVAVDWSLPKATYDRLASTVGGDDGDDSPDVDDSPDAAMSDAGDADDSAGAHVDEMDQDGSDDGDSDVDETAFEVIHSDDDDHDDEDGIDADGDDSNDDDDENETASESTPRKSASNNINCSLFIRNLSFETDETELKEAFTVFGRVRYALITRDKQTGQSRGTGFVCFMREEDAGKCLDAYTQASSIASFSGCTGANATDTKCGRDCKGKTTGNGAGETTLTSTKSILAPEAPQFADATSSAFLIGGRFLNVTLAVTKTEADELAQSGKLRRRAQDKRNLYLMREGVIFPDTDAAKTLTPTELSKRQASYALRKRQLAINPNLFISRTRLSIRNLPLTVTDHDLRRVSKQAVSEFWRDVADGTRTALEPEVIQEETDAGKPAPGTPQRRAPVITQAKILCDRDRVDASTGKPRSKGIAFVEFVSHADALACLRWMNNNPVAFAGCGAAAATASAASAAAAAAADGGVSTTTGGKGKKAKKGATSPATTSKPTTVSKQTRRPIVEFAVENRQMLKVRDDRIRASKTRRGNDTDQQRAGHHRNASSSASAAVIDSGVSGHRNNKDFDKKKRDGFGKGVAPVAKDGGVGGGKKRSHGHDSAPIESDKDRRAKRQRNDTASTTATTPVKRPQAKPVSSVADTKTKTASVAKKHQARTPTHDTTTTPKPVTKRQERAARKNKDEHQFESLVAKYRRGMETPNTASTGKNGGSGSVSSIVSKPMSISKWYE